MYHVRGKFFGRTVAVALLVALPFCLQIALAAEFVVTSNEDSGPGSLREVVALANASPGADNIIFGGIGTNIVLTGSQIDITDHLTITGKARATVIRGNDNSRIFGVTAADLTVRLENLVLVEGRAEPGQAAIAECGAGTINGGAICSLSPLHLINSRVLDSVAVGGQGGGVWITGAGNSLFENSSVAGNIADSEGGGIYATGSGLTLFNARVYDNQTTGAAAHGGGIFYDGGELGDLVVLQSEISSNGTAGLNADGGGVWVDGQTFIGNSTLSGNLTLGGVAEGGAFYSARGGVSLQSATITANTAAFGGAVDLADQGVRRLSLLSTILAGNTAPAGNLFVFPSVIVDATASVFGDQADEINGISAFNVLSDEPALDLLTDNGCFVPAGVGGLGVSRPSGCVLTHAPLPGSPALDAGQDVSNAYDQRGEGFARVVGPRADVGAYELAFVPNPPEGPGEPAIPEVSQQPVAVPIASPAGLALLALLLLVMGTVHTRRRARD